MSEFNPFRADRVPLTNFVGHQISKAYFAASATLEKVRHPEKDWKHAYNLRSMQKQNYDFIYGNAASALGLMVAAFVLNSIR